MYVLNPVFAPGVRKPSEALSAKEVRKSIPSFATTELEQHLQKHPSAAVKYLGWQVETHCYVALDIPSYYFELNKSGHAPIDPLNKTYLHYESVHLVDILHRQVVCRRFVENPGLLLVVNGTIPSWGCIHSTKEPGCFRFFKFSGVVDFVQLDSVWIRTIAPFYFQFACGKENFPFSKSSMVKLFVEHNTLTGEWRTQGFVIRRAVNAIDDKEPDLEPEQRMCEVEKAEWRLRLPQVSPSKVPEMVSASRIDNCQRYCMVRDMRREYENRKHPESEQHASCGC